MNNAVNILREGSMMKSLTKLGIPIVIAMLIMAIYNVVDTFWVARLGTLPVAAVSVVFPLSLVFLGIGLKFGVGGGVYIYISLIGCEANCQGWSGSFRLSDHLCDFSYSHCPCMQRVSTRNSAFHGGKRGDDELSGSIWQTVHRQLCHRNVECVDVQYYSFSGGFKNVCIGNDNRFCYKCRIGSSIYLCFRLGCGRCYVGNHSFKNHDHNHLHLLLYESRGESFVGLVRPNDKNVLGHHKDRYFNALFATPPNTFD